MGKKYLSLDEAADRLGISKDEMLKLRDDGEIRGFADRGDVKFREDDVDEFLRGRQTDSSPNFPILNSDSASVLDDDEDDAEFSSSDSDVRLSFDESMFSDDDDAISLDDSGSDVRLSGDSGPKLESESSGPDD